MPLLMIYGAEMPEETKAAMAKDATASVAKHYQVPETMVSVFFVPLSKQDAFHAGKPIEYLGSGGDDKNVK